MELQSQQLYFSVPRGTPALPTDTSSLAATRWCNAPPTRQPSVTLVKKESLPPNSTNRERREMPSRGQVAWSPGTGELPRMVLMLLEGRFNPWDVFFSPLLGFLCGWKAFVQGVEHFPPPPESPYLGSTVEHLTLYAQVRGSNPSF